jgi:predicted Zn-dependent protease
MRYLILALTAILAACSVSQDQEVALGAAQAAQIDSQVPLIHDTMVDRFVSGIGHALASHTSRADLDWHFAVVNSPEVNAFALPGGYVFVNRGAIEQADRLDELVGIMGHEVGHVVRRHGVEQLQKRERGQLGLVILCTLTRACSSVRGVVAVDVSTKALAAHYSQRDEAQADSEGVLNTYRAGYDAEGLPAFFEKLLQEQKDNPTLVEALFSTHPTDAARIAATRQEIVTVAPQFSGHTYITDTPEFQALRTYVKSLPAAPAQKTP